MAAQSRTSPEQLADFARGNIGVIGVAVLIPVLYLFLQQDYALLITSACVAAILILGMRSQVFAILGVFAYLILLGDIRRIMTTLVGARALDPLLLVGAAFALYYALPLVLNVRLTETLSKLMMALMTVMFLQIFNPRQGPLAVGISGAFFALIPVLWFWIGRRFGSDRTLFLLFYRVLLPLGVVCALLGLYQSFVGFLPWEDEWLKANGAAYTFFAGHSRPFGFSTSGAEYGTLLLITAVLIVGAAIAKRYVYLIALPIVGWAMVLSGMRGPIVRLLFAGAIMWAIRGKSVKVWIPRLIFALILGIGFLTYSASQSSDSSGAISNKSTANYAAGRVTQGLAHPLDDKYSTGGLHWQLFVGGIVRGFTLPTGAGLGSTTLGAGKFGGDAETSYSSEVDISDAFMTMGFLGGLLYLSVVFWVFGAVPAFVRGGPPTTRLLPIGILAALLGGWVALGQYGTGPIAWFCIGALVHDRSILVPRARKAKKGFLDSGLPPVPSAPPFDPAFQEK